MAKRYELTDDKYEVIVDLLPTVGRPGGAWKDHRTVLNGIFWIQRTGTQ